MPNRRHLLRCAWPAVALPWLAACAGPALPALRWVRLPVDPPGPEAPPGAPVAGVWQLMAPLTLPGHLDREALLVPQGATGLQGLGGARWAEPLRDAVPRLLRRDLERAFGAPLWAAPLPPGVRPTRQLRIDLLAFDITADGRAVALAARWSLADPQGATAPVLHTARFDTPAGGADAEALVLAHRLALARLAQRVADSVRA